MAWPWLLVSGLAPGLCHVWIAGPTKGESWKPAGLGNVDHCTILGVEPNCVLAR